MQAWRVAAASAIGTSHVASGTKCQDAHGFGVFDASGENILILVVSDGAGSAKHSEDGSAMRGLNNPARDRDVFRSIRDF